MKPIEIEGGLQTAAGVALLEVSRLVEWSAETHEFRPIERTSFEFWWRTSCHPVFGRLVSWQNFSSGAELFLKGICLANRLDFRSEKEVPVYPNGSLDDWAELYSSDWRAPGTISATNFGTLFAFTAPKGPKLLEKLCELNSATSRTRRLLVAAYGLLYHAVRNRDAHAYVPNVRDSHQNLVPELFAGVLTTLASWAPGGPSTVTQWRETASDLIQSQ